MFYLSDPFLLNPADKKPDKKEGSQFPQLYKKFHSIFFEERVFISHAKLATPAACNFRKPGTG